METHKSKGAAGNRRSRLLLPIALGYVWFFLLELLHPEPVFWVHSPLDDAIPFVGAFIIPYVLWYLYAFGFLLWYYLKDTVLFVRLARYMGAILLISCFVYTVVPNGQQLRPAEPGGDIFSRVCALLYSIDTPTNSFPSIHAAFSVAVHITVLYDRKRGWPFKSASFVLCAFICVSTVMVKQHSVLCLYSGLGLAGVLYPYAFREEVFRRKSGKV